MQRSTAIGIVEGVAMTVASALALQYSTRALAAVLALCVVLLFILHGGPGWLRRRSDRRRASLPSESEFGFFDHGARIEPLWKHRWDLKQRLYDEAVWLDKQVQKGLDSIKHATTPTEIEILTPRLLDSLAATLRRRIGVFADIATTHALAVESLSRSYAHVMARPNAIVVVPSAINSLQKRVGWNIKNELAEDLAIWERLLEDCRKGLGYTFLYTREMERFTAALATTINGYQRLQALIGAIEQSINSQQPSIPHTGAPSPSQGV